MANSNQTSDNPRKKGDKSQRPGNPDQQNQGGQRSHTDQQNQGHRDSGSGSGQQTGGDMNRKDTSK
jgi:hypothetical protein